MQLTFVNELTKNTLVVVVMLRRITAEQAAPPVAAAVRAGHRASARDHRPADGAVGGAVHEHAFSRGGSGAEMKAVKDLDETKRQQRVRNRWHLAYTLVNNPRLKYLRFARMHCRTSGLTALRSRHVLVLEWRDGDEEVDETPDASSKAAQPPPTKRTTVSKAKKAYGPLDDSATATANSSIAIDRTHFREVRARACAVQADDRGAGCGPGAGGGKRHGVARVVAPRQTFFEARSDSWC